MQDIAALIPSGVVVLNSDNCIIYLNPFADQLLGYKPGSLIGKRMDMLLTVASRIYFQTHLYPLITLGKLANELYLTLQTQTGVRIPVLLNASMQLDSSGEGSIYMCFIPVYQRRQYEQELLASRKAAQQALLRNDELIALQEQLESQQVILDRQVTSLQQRNNELEQFGRIIAHDLQEPLRKITLFASVLDNEKSNARSDIGRQGLISLVKASTRLRALIQDLQLYFTFDHHKAALESVDLGKLIHQIILEYASTEARFELTSLPIVTGYRKELTSLFRHLLDNAVKFQHVGMAPVIQITGTIVGLNKYRTTPDKYQYIDYARITVSDNGIGFNNQYREEIFGILKKLDPHTPGIGLGLSLAKKIVERHNGLISAESGEGKGTTVTLLLPMI